MINNCGTLFHLVSPTHLVSPPLLGPPSSKAPKKDESQQKHLFVVQIDQINVYAIELIDYRSSPDDSLEQEPEQKIGTKRKSIDTKPNNKVRFIYVSKVDSSGYLDPGLRGIFQRLTAVLIRYILSWSEKNGDDPFADIKRTFISLTAKAQAQYLFMKSVDNKTKKILDDTGLIKWWCRVLKLVMEEDSLHYENGKKDSHPPSNIASEDCTYTKLDEVKPCRIYIKVPGIEINDYRALLPPRSNNIKWLIGSPFSVSSGQIRNKIPRFTDDPKHRFLIDLDEASVSEKDLNNMKLQEFWVRLALRQECTAGHLIGFLNAELNGQLNTRSSDKSISNLIKECRCLTPEPNKLKKNTSLKRYNWLLKDSLLGGTYDTRENALVASQRWNADISISSLEVFCETFQFDPTTFLLAKDLNRKANKKPIVNKLHVRPKIS